MEWKSSGFSKPTRTPLLSPPRHACTLSTLCKFAATRAASTVTFKVTIRAFHNSSSNNSSKSACKFSFFLFFLLLLCEVAYHINLHFRIVCRALEVRNRGTSKVANDERERERRKETCRDVSMVIDRLCFRLLDQVFLKHPTRPRL